MMDQTTLSDQIDDRHDTGEKQCMYWQKENGSLPEKAPCYG